MPALYIMVSNVQSKTPITTKKFFSLQWSALSRHSNFSVVAYTLADSETRSKGMGSSQDHPILGWAYQFLLPYLIAVYR